MKWIENCGEVGYPPTSLQIKISIIIQYNW